MDRPVERGIVYGLFAALAFAIVWQFIPPATPAPSADATVLVTLTDRTTGSAVSIGDGYLLTAQHLLVGDSPVDIKTSLGDHAKAHALWSNKDYDVALLKLDAPLSIGAERIACGPLVKGESVSLAGNPANIEFVTTTGTVAAPATKRYDWHNVAVVDGTIIQGMSGGSATNEYGDLVGIIVGVITAPSQPFGETDSGLGLVVPSSAICELLARS